MIDEGEECDDGNGVFDDGCHLCLAAVCGNGRWDVGEQCDDAIDDGCIDCVVDVPNFQLQWSLQNVDGTSMECPPGFPLMDIHGDDEQTGPHLFQFPCTDFFDSVPMLRDRYTITAVSNDFVEAGSVTERTGVECAAMWDCGGRTDPRLGSHAAKLGAEFRIVRLKGPVEVLGLSPNNGRYRRRVSRGTLLPHGHARCRQGYR